MFPDKKLRALASAAADGDIKKIDALVSDGIDVNERGKAGATVLFWAYRKGNLKGFTHLLKLGSDPNAFFGNGAAVIYWIVTDRNTDFLNVWLDFDGNPNLVIPESFNDTPLLLGVSSIPSNGKDYEIIDILLENGGYLEARNEIGNTALLQSAIFHRYDLVYKFIQLGADTTVRNNKDEGIAESFLLSERVLHKHSEPYQWLLKVKYLVSR